MAEEISLTELLTKQPSMPGLVELYQRTMLHRTNEALNGLSNRLDKIILAAEANGKSQAAQQRAMIWLTAVLAVATVAYTVTTIWSTIKTSQPTTSNSVGQRSAAQPVFVDKHAAEAALRKAPELTLGTTIRDSAGCLYSIGSQGSDLVLVPINVNGSRICTPSR